MKELVNNLLLKDKVEFHGSMDTLKKRLRESKGRRYDVEWISNTEFKFLSKVSFGILIMSGAPNVFDGIKGYANIQEKENNLIEIYLATKIRVEMYFFSGVFAFIFLGAMFMKESIPIWIYFFLPITLTWFWYIFRVQEKMLFKRVKDHLEA